MVPPDSLFGVIPISAGVYLVSAFVFGLSGLILYTRVFRLVLLGKPADRTDQPVRRLVGAISLIFGQRKVLQSVSIRRDRAGLAHFFIFWGFLSFLTSYLIFIFGNSAWRPFSSKLLTDAGVEVFVFYLDVLAVTFFAVLLWAALRRWMVRPHRLTFDLTQEEGVDGYPPAHRPADVPDAADRGVLRRVGWRRATRVGSHRVRPRQAFRGLRNGPGAGQRPSRRLLVDPPRLNPGLLSVHTSVQAHAYNRRADILPDAPRWKPKAPCRHPRTWRPPRALGQPRSRISRARSCWMAFLAPCVDAARRAVRRTSAARYCRPCT